MRQNSLIHSCMYTCTFKHLPSGYLIQRSTKVFLSSVWKLFLLFLKKWLKLTFQKKNYHKTLVHFMLLKVHRQYSIVSSPFLFLSFLRTHMYVHTINHPFPHSRVPKYKLLSILWVLRIFHLLLIPIPFAVDTEVLKGGIKIGHSTCAP